MNWKNLFYKLTHFFKSEGESSVSVAWMYKKCGSCGDSTCVFSRLRYKNRGACEKYKSKT